MVSQADYEVCQEFISWQTEDLENAGDYIAYELKME